MSAGAGNDRHERIPVGVLGATGAVGQRLVQLLASHPWFELRALAASDRSAGHRYAEIVRWHLDEALPEEAGRLQVLGCDPEQMDVPVVFSGLDASVAGEIEERFARAGAAVLSNARNHRMDPDVPLLVPELNADHLELVERQAERWGGPGCIVANPNCSTVGLALVLGPLERRFGLRRVMVSTLQAVSGAGYPGVPSLDVTDNVIPFIGGEEEKIETETLKILGSLAGGGIEPLRFPVSAMVHRVGVRDGHLLAISLELEDRASPREVETALQAFRGPDPVPRLPSSPATPIIVRPEADRPQPRRDRMEGNGMTVVAGRVRRCGVLDVKLSALVHNTIRGAAGAAIQNAELLLVARPFLRAAASVPRVAAAPVN